MKKTTMTFVLLFLTSNLILSQNSHNYIIKYKTTSFEENISFIKELLYKNIQNTYFSNKEVCFQTDFIMELPKGMKMNMENHEKQYINYENDRLYWDLNAETAYDLKEIKFEKLESGKTKFMGFDITKYKSIDGYTVVFVTEELPWYIQPCMFTSNKFDGAILKVMNYNDEVAFTLTDYKQIAVVPEEYKEIIKKIKNHPAVKVKKIDNPFLDTEEEKKEKMDK